MMTLIVGIAGLGIPISHQGHAADFVVYNVFRGINLGNANENPEKDYYINMGSAQGLQNGSFLTVFRHVATYDLSSQQLYRDVTFPIARVKVIHVESKASIARLEKMLPVDKTPSLSPQSIMVGDFVRIAAETQ